MDYGKYTYLKLAELENNINEESNISSASLEFDNSPMNKTVSGSYSFQVGSVFAYGKANYQNKILLEAAAQTDIQIDLLFDGVAVKTELQTIPTGQTAIILTKTFMPDLSADIDLSINVTVLTNGTSVKILSNLLTCWGEIKESSLINSCNMQVLKIDNGLLISYISNGKIYYCITTMQEKSIRQADFVFLANGQSYSFAKDKSSGQIYFFRVDYDGNLFYSRFTDTLVESVIDTGVTCVFSRECPESFLEDMLICYIKNKKPCYRSMKNQTIASLCVLDAPKDKYKSVYIAESGLDKMFVVCTTEKDVNYILFSQKDTNLSQFFISINANFAVFVQRYVNIGEELKNWAEEISASFAAGFSRYLIDYQNLLGSKLVERINAKFSFAHSAYTIDESPELNYYLHYKQTDRATTVPQRITFSGDCADWTFAHFDLLGDGHLVDEGNLLSKWPFNQIKPCLVKDGEVVCYLNPNNFALKEDGTNADITSGTYDVMIQFPKMYIKIEHDWDGVNHYLRTTKAEITISVSNKPKEGYKCLAHTKQGVEYDYIYVSAYQSHIKNGTIYSCSGKLPNSDVSHKVFLDNFANYKNSSYTTLTYHFLTYIRVLQMLLFGENYGVNSYGYGWLSSSSLSTIDDGSSLFDLTGNMDTSGMYNCVMAPQDTTNIFTPPVNAAFHNKIFGLEDIFGNSKTYLDGILYTTDNKFRIIDPTNPNSTVNYLGTNYNVYDFNLTSNSYNGWVAMYAAGTDFGFLPVYTISANSTGRAIYGVKAYMYRSYDTTDGYSSFGNNIVFALGGDYTGYTGLELYTDRYYYESQPKHNERLMCYPNSKKSV